VAGAGNGASPKTRILPPVFFLLAVGIMAALDYLAPGPQLVTSPYTYLGWVPFALAAVVVLVARNLFVRSGTTVKPFEDSSTLVTDGVYAVSRNPMYVCLTVALIGVVVLFGTLTPVVVVPGFVWLIRNRFIAVEERMLEDAFGDAYRDYKARVRRWL
jgi:protein-S-isoprenylcysteine O-methyltransferase Ste14